MKQVKAADGLKIQYLPIEALKVCSYNPRLLSPKQEIDLTASIEQFGMVSPILVNCNKDRFNFVVGGAQRLKIAEKLGYKEIPAIYVNLSEERERILNLRLNKNVGSWNFDLLKDFKIETLLEVGFDMDEIGMVWNDVLEIEDDGFSVEKELEKIKTTDIKAGDLFALGSHKLLCNDSTQLESVKLLMGGEKTSFIYCDPVYNISLNYNKGIGGSKNYGGHTDDTKTDDEYREFLKQTIVNAISVSNPDSHFFYYCDQRYIGLLQSLYSELGIKNQRVCLWVKNGFNATPQVAFNKCYEPCVYGVKGRPFLAPIHNLNEIMNKEIGTGNRTIDDILDILDIWLAKRLPGQEYTHATSKNPTLHEKPLRRCTQINDIVLDLFCGGGSTLAACEQLKRRAFLIEKEPIFCQLVINRFEQLTGEKARLLNK